MGELKSEESDRKQKKKKPNKKPKKKSTGGPLGLKGEKKRWRGCGGGRRSE